MAAYEMYGIPPANRLSEKVGGIFGHWNDYCDWDRGIYKFYIAAKYFKTYAPLTIEKKNCAKLKSTLDFLEQEKLNADKAGIYDPATRDTSLSVLNDIQSKYMVGYSNLLCDEYLAKIDVDRAKSDISEEEQKTQDALKKVTLTKVFIYGISLMILTLGVIKLAKK
jgi:hypothetical protein